MSSRTSLLTVDHRKSNELTFGQTIMLGCVQMSVALFLFLPHAVSTIGLTSTVTMLAFFSLAMWYSTSCLTQCWPSIQNRAVRRYSDDNGDTHIRVPYAAISEQVGLEWSPFVGRLLHNLTIAALAVVTYGSYCVILTLASDIMANLTHGVPSICQWIVISSIICAPLSWFGSFKDMKVHIVMTVTFFSIFFVLMVVELKQEAQEVDLENCSRTGTSSSGAMDHFVAFSAIMFGYFGIFYAPNAQADMEDKSKAGHAFMVVSGILFLAYSSFCVISHFIMHDCVEANILDSFRDGMVKDALQVMILMHSVLCSSITINLPHQMFEDILDISRGFNWKRILFRVTMALILLLVMELIPNFADIMNLVASTAGTLLAWIMPPLFFIIFATVDGTLRYLDLVICITLIIIGIVAGCIATYVSVSRIIVHYSDLSQICFAQL